MILGSALCAIVGRGGNPDFFNAILTGILSRKREFAMLQAVGMTGRQLKKMLMLEGVLYGGMTILLSLVLILVLEPLTGRMLESMFWFFAYRFNITAVFAAAPVFLLLGDPSAPGGVPEHTEADDRGAASGNRIETERLSGNR